MVAPGARPRSRAERSESQIGQGSASATGEPETESLAQYYYVTVQGLGQIPIPVRFRHSWGISVKRFWLSNLRSLFADIAAPWDALKNTPVGGTGRSQPVSDRSGKPRFAIGRSSPPGQSGRACRLTAYRLINENHKTLVGARSSGG